MTKKTDIREYRKEFDKKFPHLEDQLLRLDEDIEILKKYQEGGDYMSANNVIYINRQTFEVYHQHCDDNADYGEKIGKGKNREEAVNIAQKELEEYGEVEYGIRFL